LLTKHKIGFSYELVLLYNSLYPHSLYEVATHYPLRSPSTQYHGLLAGQRTEAYNLLFSIGMYLPSTLT